MINLGLAVTFSHWLCSKGSVWHAKIHTAGRDWETQQWRRNELKKCIHVYTLIQPDCKPFPLELLSTEEISQMTSVEALLWKVVSTTGTSMFTYSETFLSLTYKTRLICIVRLCKCQRQMKKTVIGILLRRIYIFKAVADVEVMQGLFFR